MKEAASVDYWQAGKSVAGIDQIESAADIVRRFAAALGEPRAAVTCS